MRRRDWKLKSNLTLLSFIGENQFGKSFLDVLEMQQSELSEFSHDISKRRQISTMKNSMKRNSKSQGGPQPKKKRNQFSSDQKQSIPISRAVFKESIFLFLTEQ